MASNSPSIMVRKNGKFFGESSGNGVEQDHGLILVVPGHHGRFRRFHFVWKTTKVTGSDRGIDGIAYIFGGTAIFSVKSSNISVKDIRDFQAVIEREKAVAGIFITLHPPTKPMLQEAASLGFLEKMPGLKMSRKTPKLQIVTIQELLDGARMNLPLAEAVVKSAERESRKIDNPELKFD